MSTETVYRKEQTDRLSTETLYIKEQTDSDVVDRNIV